MALAKKDLELLQGVGFSEEQASAILSVSKSEVAKTEEKMVTKGYLELKFREMNNKFGEIDNKFREMNNKFREMNTQFKEIGLKFKEMDTKFRDMKSQFIVLGVSIVLASLVLLGWHVSHLDNKTRLYVEARFQAQDQRFDDFKDSVEARFDAQDKRFDKIDSSLNDIKNFIFETKATNNK